MTKKKVNYDDPNIIDDRIIAKPFYDGPNKTPLPVRKLSQAEIQAMIAQMFRTEGEPKPEQAKGT
jgi:hypothetical protein